MTNPISTLSPRSSDTLDEAADAYDASEVAHAPAVASEVTDAEPCAAGPGEVVAGSLAALAYLVRVGLATGSLAILAECEVVYVRTRRQLSDWRIAADCADWATADWARGEVQACAECEGALDGIKARLLDYAAGLDGATYRRLCRAA